MSQNALNQGNGDGATVRGGLVAGLQALATMQSGATAPATPYPFMFWADTTAGVLKQRNAANSAWLEVGTLNADALGLLDRITGTASFKQLNSTPALATVGQILSFISTLTPGSETGGLRFNSKIAGVLTKLLELETVARLFGAAAELSWADNGTGEGPDWDLIRESASPAANDLLAGVRWKYRDSGANLEIGAKIVATLLDPTNGSEDVALDLFTQVAGALASRMQLRNGLIMAGATGGDPGAGQINATGYKLNGAALSLGLSVMHVQDQKADGTAGGASVAAWTTRVLNTVVQNGIAGASLSGNLVTLPAGSYVFIGQASYFAGAGQQARILNSTDTTVVAKGPGHDTGASGLGNSAPVVGFTTIASAKDFALQMRVETARATDGFGTARSWTGEVEVFSDLLILKVA